MSGSTSINAQAFGVLTANWGSVKIDFDKGASFTQGGLVAKQVIAGNKIFYSFENKGSMVKGSFVLTKKMSLATILAQNGNQLILNCDTGQRYVINNAVLTNDLPTKSGAGANVSAEWSGEPAAEVIP